MELMTLQIPKTRTCKTPLATYAFDIYGIVHVESSGAEVTDQAVETNYQMLKAFLKGEKVKMFIDNTQSVPYEKKYRLSFERQLHQFCTAVAITSKSKIGIAVAQIFLAMTKVEFPIKIFKDNTEALQWLIWVD